MELNDLLREGEALKAEIDAKKARLKEINLSVAQKAHFKTGSKTGHAVGAGVRAKVTIKANIKWDQERLKKLREYYPDQFKDGFKPEYKPTSAQVLEVVAAQHKDFADGVKWACTVTPGAPQVSYEPIEEEVPNAA